MEYDNLSDPLFRELDDQMCIARTRLADARMGIGAYRALRDTPEQEVVIAQLAVNLVEAETKLNSRRAELSYARLVKAASK